MIRVGCGHGGEKVSFIEKVICVTSESIPGLLYL